MDTLPFLALVAVTVIVYVVTIWIDRRMTE